MMRTRGFSLLELMVVVVIVGLILVTGVPSLFLWLANVRVRAGAEGLQNGIRLAQTEAVRRNATVNLKLTSDATPTVSSSVSSSGVNWFLTDTSNNLIQAKGSESATGLVQNPSPSGTLHTAGVIQFFSLGNNDLSGTTKFVFSGAGSNRPLAVMVTQGGRVRLCDPNVNIAGDTRTCE